MSAEFDGLLAKLEAHKHLDEGGLDRLFAIVMDGAAPVEQIKPFLLATVPLMRDPHALAAGARALRERMVRVQAPEGAIDVCGTGGDGAHTLNISTAVAFVVAGCGVPVAKHGNRAMSSKSGAADVLEALGVKLTADVPTLERCLREAGVAFLFAQNHHPAMRHVGPARRQIGQRTIFNLLGPLSNPAGVKRQLVGVFAKSFVEPMAEALRELGSEFAVVVHGAGEVDELSFHGSGKNTYATMTQGADLDLIEFNGQTIWPNPPKAEISDILGGEATFNANALRRLLQNDTSLAAYRNVVLLNAALAIGIGKKRNVSWASGWQEAEDSLRSGAALAALDNLIEITNGAP